MPLPIETRLRHSDFSPTGWARIPESPSERAPNRTCRSCVHTKGTGLTFHRAPSVRLAATQLNICMKIRAETSAVPGSRGPLTPQASRLQGSAKHSAGAIRKTIISIQMCAGGL